MSAADRSKWDAKYAAIPLATELAVDPWFIEVVAPLPPGRALDVACGLGHHAIWLAERGWQVTAVDVSPVGLAKARELADQWNAAVEWRAADLDEFCPDVAAFDLIAVFRFLDRRQLPQRLTNALKPQGRLVYCTFCAMQAVATDGHVRNPAFVLQPGELSALFPQLRPEQYSESDCGGDGYARFVGVNDESQVRK
ncbi:MAG TPA: class I SAM-dependent methyltransferase [Planctomycetaceae bacterium]|nr:class I SAM-dependent methyltransferase [Planctomycetaceae bacterium]